MALNSNYAVQILRAGGWPVTKQNIQFIQAWHQREGGGDHNTANFNPLNTTHGPGPSINSVGVKSFANPKQGAKMTVQTILNGRYPDIARGLAAGNPYQAPIADDLSTWVSGSPTKGLSYARSVMGGKGASAPVRGVALARTQPRSGAEARQSRNQILAQGLLGFVNSYLQTGQVSSNAVATLTGAVSKAGTVEPPVRKGSIPSSKGRGELGNGLVDKVLAAAHTQVGKPYVFGSGPDTSSFDCSDLVQWAYKQVGIEIPRTTYEQMKVLPKKSWKNLAPGDLIYRNNGGHVVMYVGGGKVIAAPYTGTVVQYQPVSKFENGDYHVRSVM